MGDHKDPDRYLVLEKKSKDGSCYERVAVLFCDVYPQKYTFGIKYPGIREGEEFVFCRPEDENKYVVEPTHCSITVREEVLGRDKKRMKYWIENGSPTAVTFVNFEKLEEPRPLNNGDSVAFGIANNCRHTVEGPAFRVEVHDCGDVKIPQQKEGEEEEAEQSEGAEGGVVFHEEPPLENRLILSKILDYLPFEELKTTRLVCKKWNEEGSKILEKKAEVCFVFGCNYENPQASTRVLNYTHVMRKLQIRNVNIEFDLPGEWFFESGEAGEKMMDDVKKLLGSSSNSKFSVLVLDYTCFICQSNLLLVHSVLEKLGPNLIELELDGWMGFIDKDFNPQLELIPPLPAMTNLKKFTSKEETTYKVEKWTQFLVPLFRETLQQFIPCSMDALTKYLQEFVKQEGMMANLDTVMVVDGEDFFMNVEQRERMLDLLCQLRNPLKSLNLSCKFYENVLLDQLLLKNSNSLKRLTLQIEEGMVTFPALPRLEELNLQYIHDSKVRWAGGNNGMLNFKQHLPSLKKMNIELYHECFDTFSSSVFDSFFLFEDEISCETVTHLLISFPLDPDNIPGLIIDQYSRDENDCKVLLSEDEDAILKYCKAFESLYKECQERLTKIKKHFPNVKKIEIDHCSKYHVNE